MVEFYKIRSSSKGTGCFPKRDHQMCFKAPGETPFLYFRMSVYSESKCLLILDAQWDYRYTENY